MWIYFSSAVLLFGAGCAKAVDEERLAKEARLKQPTGASSDP